MIAMPSKQAAVTKATFTSSASFLIMAKSPLFINFSGGQALSLNLA